MILKQLLNITISQTVELPKGAKILNIGEQAKRHPHSLVLWYLAPREEKEVSVAETIKINFKILPTGSHPEEEGLEYDKLDFIQTVQCENGLVWHVFIQRKL